MCIEMCIELILELAGFALLLALCDVVLFLTPAHKPTARRAGR